VRLAAWLAVSPFRRNEDSNRFWTPVTGHQWPLVRLAALQSVIDAEVASTSGYSLPPGTRRFRRLGGFSPAASPAPLRDRVHPLMSFTPSSEYVPFGTCPTSAETSTGHLPGFSSHSRQEYSESTYRRASQPRLCFALSVSHALDDLLLRIPRGLVSSHSHVRDSLFRGFPRCQAALPHRQAVLSCRLQISPTGELPHQRQLHLRRLQSVSPGSDPLRPTGGLDLRTTRSPLGLSTPSGFRPSTLATPSRLLRL